MAQVVARFDANISPYQAAMEKIKGATGTATKATSGMSQRVHQAMSSIGKTTTVAGAAMTAMGVSAMKSYGSFQQSLNKAAVIAGGTSKDIGKLSDMANRMGAELPLSAQDAADAMVAMAQDGASIKTITKEFPAIAQAATATGDDLQTTASVVQQSMNVWGKSLKSPQQAAAILTSTANMSNASISDMQQAIATIGGTASNAGLGMGDMSESIGLMTNKGFSAAQASMDLNHAILQMQAPSAKAKKEMNALGLSFTDSSGKMKPFPTILREVAAATDGMSSSQKTAALKTMFNTAGMQAMLPLLASVEDKSGSTTTSWDAYAKAQDKASGSTQAATKFLQDQANEMQQNLGSKIEQVGGNWESLRNKAMEATSGVNSGIVDMINKTLEWASSSNSAGASAIRSFAGLTPVIGAAMTGMGSFLIVANGVSTFFMNFKEFMPTLGSALVNPWTLGLAAVVGFVAILVKAYNQSETFRNAVSAIADAFNSVFGPAIQSAISFIKNLWTSITGGSGGAKNAIDNLAGAIGDGLGTALNAIDWEGVFGTAKTIIETVVTVVKTLVTTISSVVQGFTQTKAAAATWEAIVAVVKAVWNVIKTVVTVLGTVIGAVVKVVSAFLQLEPVQGVFKLIGAAIGTIVTVIAKVITAVANMVSAILNPAETIKTIWTGISDFFSGLWTGITTNAQTNWQTFSDTMSGVWQGIVTGAAPIWNGLTSFFGNLWTGIQTTMSNQWQVISGALSTSWQGILDIAGGIWGMLKDAIMGPVLVVLDALTGDWTQLGADISMIWNDIISNGKQIWGGLVGYFSGIWQHISGTASNVWNGITSTLSSIWNTAVSTGKSKWSGFKSDLSGIWSSIKTNTSNTWTGIKTKVTTSVSNAVTSAKGKWADFKSNTAATWANMKSNASSSWSSMKTTIGTAASNMVTSARTSWAGFKTAASTAVSNVKSSFSSLSWFSLFNAGSKIIDSFRQGMVSAFNSVKSFVSGIAGWIRSHKGPISYDAKLLIPAGNAIMDGLNKGLQTQFGTVQKNVSSMADRLAGSVSGVVSDLNAGDLAMSAASYTAGDMTQSIDASERIAPEFYVHNEIVGDKIYTTVKNKESRDYNMDKFFKR